jgi:hypothetical protein
MLAPTKTGGEATCGSASSRPHTTHTNAAGRSRITTPQQCGWVPAASQSWTILRSYAPARPRASTSPQHVPQTGVLWHNTYMGIEWPESADKHDIPHADALYAMQNATYTSTKVKINDGDTRNQRRVFIGPQHAQTDRLIEVLIELKPGGNFVVYHVMPLGAYYRRQMEEENE